MKPKTERRIRLAMTIEQGRHLARFVEDPAIAAIFDDMEAAAIEAMIAAKSDLDRQAEALRIQVIRQLQSTLADKAAQAVRAASTLDQVKHA